MKPAKKISELPKLLGGQPVGSTFKIEGYVDSAGATKDLLVKTLGPNDYASMKQKSLEILEKNTAPELPGFPPVIVAQARDALMASYRGSSQSESFKDPYVAAEEGGYSIKPGEPSIYMLRLEDLSPRDKSWRDTRIDLVRAKAAMVRALDLPAGRYMHTVKLTDGKFKSVQKV